MNHYPHHIGDFNNATRHLNRLERSIYRDAIELYYDKESPLIAGVAQLSRRLLVTTEAEVEALQNVLEEFFKLETDGYHNHRCDSEIAKYHGFLGRQSKAGKASARARRNTATIDAEPALNDGCTDVEPALNDGCTGVQPTNNHKPITSKPITSKNLNTLPGKPDPATQIFDYWASVMGKNRSTTKLSKKRKKLIQARLAEGYTVDQIMSAILNCKQDSWSMGANDRQKPFNDIELICRSGEKLESFIDLGNFTPPGGQSEPPTGSTRRSSLAEDLGDTSWAN